MNRKTTYAGVAAIIAAVASAAFDLFQGKPIDYGVVLASILAGIGLIRAADAKK